MLAPVWRAAGVRSLSKSTCHEFANIRSIATDARDRISSLWTPTGGISAHDEESDKSHALLMRAGFLRQAHSGVFHFLPLGLRVQDKLEALIDHHMHSIGASKLSLSSITTEALWRRSGRFSNKSELLGITDRKGSGFLLSPTHEEEITALIASLVNSYKDLPLRLYQVGRKYRDERRPRQGLLRAKEFMMKDLYTFDSSSESALGTYEAVQQAYNNLFTELKIPFRVAQADSGNIGGKLSHEYHYISDMGEDSLWSCDVCDYTANEEIVEKSTRGQAEGIGDSVTFTAISKDHVNAIKIHVPGQGSIRNGRQPMWSEVTTFVNMHALKRVLPRDIEIATGIESSTLSKLLSHTSKTIDIYDCALSDASSSTADITAVRPGDPCPRCRHGSLRVMKAIEIGHTFHLGSRYSECLNALVAVPGKPTKEPIQMGCHGIGVSRIIGAAASLLCDDQGLQWPRAMAPYEVILLYSSPADEEDAVELYDILKKRTDSVLDDRSDKNLGWKLRDADLIGYPVVVVLGRAWKERKEVEVQCRRLGFKEEIGLAQVEAEVMRLLELL